MNPARLVFPALRWGDRTLEEVWPEVQEALDIDVGGFIVFGGSAVPMRQLVDRALDYASYPVLFASDLERGAGQQLRDATPLPPAAAFPGLVDTEVLEAARITAQEAAAAGIGWVLAPVADLDVEAANPIVGTRSFGSSPSHVSDLVSAWIRSLQSEGVLACVKHFPGHGRTTSDSHAELPVVDATREELESDLAPFRAAIEAGVRSVMMAHVVYPALDDSARPAGLSPPVIGLLRNELGFQGIVATDALVMEAISSSGRSVARAAVEAVQAGCDALLYPGSLEETIDALTEAVDSGELETQRVAEAGYRIASGAASAQIYDEYPAPASSHAMALDIAARSIRSLKGDVPRIEVGDTVRLQVVDDDDVLLPSFIAAPGSVLADRSHLAKALGERRVEVIGRERGGGREAAAEVVALFSEVKGWKGRSNLAATTVEKLRRVIEGSPEAALVLFGHPRLAEQLPFANVILCAWCGDALMQEAAAERLVTPPS